MFKGDSMGFQPDGIHCIPQTRSCLYAHYLHGANLFALPCRIMFRCVCDNMRERSSTVQVLEEQRLAMAKGW